MNRLAPTSRIPLAYYAVAYGGLASALIVLAVDPELPASSFYQPRMIALVHLLTLSWISGSILGSIYIVGPLALRLPLPARTGDWIAFAAFASGVAGMVWHFWINQYDAMAWSACLVTTAVAWVAVRTCAGLRHAALPWPIALHVALAFVNFIAAAMLGILIGFNRSGGFLSLPPLGIMFAHVHLAAVGWATMMVVGLSYRLIPMMLPAAMPAGASIAASAILMEAGLVVLTLSLLLAPAWVPAGAGLIVGGLVSFVLHIRTTLKRRLPRPPALPRRDWSTWQAHAALAWLTIAGAIGLALGLGIPSRWRLAWMWLYGIAGLLGFLAQIVVGMQGRLVPLYAWYSGYGAAGAPPRHAANSLPSARFALAILLAWTVGVPVLAFGLPAGQAHAVRIGAILLLAGIISGAAYIVFMLRKAHAPR
jgi:hypothetical protein